MKKFIDKFSNYYIIFCIYALIGWIYEVLWMRFVVEPHEFINRGVLFGPFLPIYGFGMLLLYFLLKKFISKKHPLSNFKYLVISSIVIVTFIYTTIIEYTTPKIYNVLFYLKHYGIGLLIVNIIVLLIIYFISKSNKKIKNIDCTIILVFLIIWIVTTLLEYVSHYVIDVYSHKMLWDYTYDFLNINARVNWDASRNFAIGGTALLYLVQPFIDKFLKNSKNKTKYIIVLIVGIPMFIDFLVNVIL